MTILLIYYWWFSNIPTKYIGFGVQVSLVPQLNISEAVYADLDDIKEDEDHKSFDSALRTLILHYRHVTPDEDEE